MAFVHKPEVHLWYVRLIIIYYLMLPFFNLFRHKWKNRFDLLVCIIVSFTFIYNGWLIFKDSSCPTSPSRSYFCYLVYMTVGYLLSKSKINKMSFCLFIVIGLIGATVLYVSLMRNPYFLWYDNPLLAVVAICLFGILRICFIHVTKCQTIIEVSKMSYGIYLSHFLFIYLGGLVLENIDCGILSFFLGWIGVLFLDTIVVFGLKRVSAKMSMVVFRY